MVSLTKDLNLPLSNLKDKVLINGIPLILLTKRTTKKIGHEFYLSALAVKKNGEIFSVFWNCKDTKTPIKVRSVGLQYVNHVGLVQSNLLLKSADVNSLASATKDFLFRYPHEFITRQLWRDYLEQLAENHIISNKSAWSWRGHFPSKDNRGQRNEFSL